MAEQVGPRSGHDAARGGAEGKEVGLDHVPETHLILDEEVAVLIQAEATRGGVVLG